MKHSGRITLILLLILTMILSACGNAGRSSTEEEEQSTRSRIESTAEAETEEETKPSRPNILSWQPLWQQHLAAVIREKQETYGKPCFVKDFITRVNGMGLVLATDLDGDRKEELIFDKRVEEQNLLLDNDLRTDEDVEKFKAKNESDRQAR